jgi:ribosomal protein S18 acetylase RimI-like enzyme
MIRIKSLKHIPISTLFQAFSRAFSDYEMQLDQSQLEKMLRRRGFDPELSFGAFENEELIAFTFNGTGKFRGIQTAYDTGTGTLREYRGQGLARRIFQYSIPFLEEAGIEQYLLEVLQHNDGAVALYKKMGFEVSREFFYYVWDNSSFQIPSRAIDKAYRIREVNTSALLQKIGNNFVSHVDYGDFYPSWQNSPASIGRDLTAFKALVVYRNEGPVAHCIFEPVSGDITSLAISEKHRRRGIGTWLLASARKEVSSKELKVINVPTDQDGAAAFLRSLKKEPSGKQYEMIRSF